MEKKLIVNPQEFQALVDFYKGKISESTLLDKAAQVAAETQMLLGDTHTQAGLKEPMIKQLLMQERQLTDQLRQLPAGVGPETGEDGEQGNLLDSVQENLIKDLIRSVKTGQEPVAVVVKTSTPPTSKKRKRKHIITPKKLFSTPGSSGTKKPVANPFTLKSLKDLPSTPILTGKRLLPSTPLTGPKAGSAHKPVQKKSRVEQVWVPWEKRGWDPVEAVQHAEYKAPKEKTRLLTIKRRVYVVVTKQLDVTTTYVHYSDIKDKPLNTPHDLLKALFEGEREKFILKLGESGVWANEMPTGKFPNLQFDVTFDDVLETCTVSAEIIPDTLSNNDVRDNVYFELRKDLCILLGWVQPKAWFNVITVKNSLAFRKRGNVWFKSRTFAKRYWSMEENGEMVKFYLHELIWTFINTKRSAYKRGSSASRTFYVYSSIASHDMSDFYLTLPSNDGSVKYFPGNTNKSWKNQLNSRIDLQGEWVVGLSSISLPYSLALKNRWEPYLKGLSDDDVLLTTSHLLINSQKTFKTVTFSITYGDIIGHTLHTPYDLLGAVFQEERLIFIQSG
ncbi:hypothetical protein AWC38_SpisGene21900 [Stylophora pistillata]|uniref:Uncharacterized protein n=1 Tax=Stylophora pistillata TaxID=50429 RepID=A0A2B4RCJ7_STYPI|nr:hypothetical protein AWC38_SpisGene21900 [Stylophora pistillata]